MRTEKASARQVVVCIDNTGYPASLERRKLYEILPDATAAAHDQVRIIDESGEDYLYPAALFVTVHLPWAKFPNKGAQLFSNVFLGGFDPHDVEAAQAREPIELRRFLTAMFPASSSEEVRRAVGSIDLEE